MGSSNALSLISQPVISQAAQYSQNTCGTRCKQVTSIASLVSCLAAVVFYTFQLNYGCTVLFGINAIISAYFVYQAFKEPGLKTLTQNNERFREQLSSLEGQNQRLNEANNNLTEQLSQLESLTHEQRASISDLSSETQNLKQVNQTLTHQATNHINQLKCLQKALSGIQISAQKDHAVFSEGLEDFSHTVTKLIQFQQEYAQMSTESTQVMQHQTDELVHASQILHDTFEAIQQWNDANANSPRIQEMESLQRMLKDLRAEHEQIIRDKSELSGQIQELESSLTDLHGIKNGFSQSLASLLSLVDRLSNGTGDLSNAVQEIKEAAKMFDLYRIKSP